MTATLELVDAPDNDGVVLLNLTDDISFTTTVDNLVDIFNELIDSGNIKLTINGVKKGKKE